MNQTYSPMQAQFNSSELRGHDPLHATTGLVWGTLMGTAFWLVVLTLVFVN